MYENSLSPSWILIPILVCLLSTEYVSSAQPPQPFGLIASGKTETSVRLSWDGGRKQQGVLSYDILYKVKSEAGGFAQLRGIQRPEKIIENLQPGTLYIFLIVSNGRGGTKSSRSIPMELTTLEIGKS